MAGRGGAFPAAGAYGAPYGAQPMPGYGMPAQQMYPVAYGRGGYPPQAPYGSQPPQGKQNTRLLSMGDERDG